MFKASGLGLGVCRFHIRPIRTLRAPRGVRAFTTTLNVSEHQQHKSSRRPARQDEKLKPKLPTIDTRVPERHELRNSTHSSTQSIQREEHGETEVREDFGSDAWIAAPDKRLQDDTSLPNTHDNAEEPTWENSDEGSNVPQGQDVWENKAAEDDQGKSKKEPREKSMGLLLLEITSQQKFHAKLHPKLRYNIMQREPLLRGMPVYDSTFDAVRSGRDLFIQTEHSVRSLQYLLPVIHGIIEFGPLRRRQKVKSDAQLPPRPSSLLVICPSLGNAQDVQMMVARLIKGYNPGVGIMTLNVPSVKQSKTLRNRGFNVLMSTPDSILQWLALPHAKPPLFEALQDVQTLVVDGKASFLRGGEFLEFLKAVMEEIPLQERTQRVIISDEHDSQLDERLIRLVLSGDYDVHQEARLEEVQAMRRARHAKKRYERELRRDEDAAFWESLLGEPKRGSRFFPDTEWWHLKAEMGNKSQPTGPSKALFSQRRRFRPGKSD